MLHTGQTAIHSSARPNPRNFTTIYELTGNLAEKVLILPCLSTGRNYRLQSPKHNFQIGIPYNNSQNKYLIGRMKSDEAKSIGPKKKRDINKRSETGKKKP